MRRTRWEHVSGTHSAFYDDVLVPASGVVAEGPSGVRLVLLVDDAGASEIAHAKAFARIEVIVVGATDLPRPEASPGLG